MTTKTTTTATFITDSSNNNYLAYNRIIKTTTTMMIIILIIVIIITKTTLHSLSLSPFFQAVGPIGGRWCPSSGLIPRLRGTSPVKPESSSLPHDSPNAGQSLSHSDSQLLPHDSPNAGQSTVGPNQINLRHQKFNFPRANGRASGPVLTSRFLFVPDHSGVA